MNPQFSISDLTNKSRAFSAIFWAGLLCGVMDISAAFLNWHFKGVQPARVLRGIASGLLGPKSFRGGIPTAALGAGIHFFVAFTAATVFYFASRRFTFMTRQPFLCGPLYGILVYTFMYWVVMPLSARRPGAFSLHDTIIAIITHIICVGTPIALVVRRFSR